MRKKLLTTLLTSVALTVTLGAGQAAAQPGLPGPGQLAPTECGAQPADREATPAARRLLCYLRAVSGNRILSGQQESTWIGGPEYEMNHIRSVTGRLPAIRGLDRGDSPTFAQRAVDWANAGGIPMVGYHMGAPTKPDGYEGSRMSVSIDAVLRPGTPEHTSFLQRLDGVSAQLQRLDDIGAPVIWRPFHEAGGTWFWWSMQGGAQYGRLWRFTFDYMTRVKGLHNLVWLHGYNGEPDGAFSPGAAYTDVVGSDTYRRAGDHQPLTQMFQRTRALAGGQPVALHENGPIPDPDLLRSTNTHWILFGTWHGTHLVDSNSPEHLRKVYSSDYVITRDELPRFR